MIVPTGLPVSRMPVNGDQPQRDALLGPHMGLGDQFRQPGGGGTNAGAIQQSRTGVPVVSVSVPHRYTHSPISIARVEDWKNTLNLLHTALKQINASLVKSKR